MVYIYTNNFSNVSNVPFKYKVPEHLQGITDIQQAREADLRQLDKELRENSSSLEEKISSGVIWRMGFPGMILDVQRINLGDYVEMTLSPIHPHRADLAYRRDRTLRENVSPLTVNGLLESCDNHFVLGIRGGIVETGKIAIIPGGHSEYTFPQITNALETFSAEFEEELGYGFSGQISPVSIFTNKDTHGINVLYKARTELNFQEVEEKWKAAKDRDEHSILIKASSEDIGQLGKEGRLTREDKEYATTPFLKDCFESCSRKL